MQKERLATHPDDWVAMGLEREAEHRLEDIRKWFKNRTPDEQYREEGFILYRITHHARCIAMRCERVLGVRVRERSLQAEARELSRKLQGERDNSSPTPLSKEPVSACCEDARSESSYSTRASEAFRHV